MSGEKDEAWVEGTGVVSRTAYAELSIRLTRTERERDEARAALAVWLTYGRTIAAKWADDDGRVATTQNPDGVLVVGEDLDALFSSAMERTLAVLVVKSDA